MNLGIAARRIAKDGEETNEWIRDDCRSVARKTGEGRIPTLLSAVLTVFRWRMSGVVRDETVLMWRDGIVENRTLALRDYQRKIRTIWQPILESDPQPDASACMTILDDVIDVHGPSWAALAPLKAYVIGRGLQQHTKCRYALWQPLGSRVRQGIRRVFSIKVGESLKGYGMSRSLHELLARAVGSNTCAINSGLLHAPARWKGRCPRCGTRIYLDRRSDLDRNVWCLACYGDVLDEGLSPSSGRCIRWSRH